MDFETYREMFFTYEPLAKVLNLGGQRNPGVRIPTECGFKGSRFISLKKACLTHPQY